MADAESGVIEKLDQAAAFMAANGIEAATGEQTVEGRLRESISFMRGHIHIAEVVFEDGQPTSTSAEETARRLQVPGFLTEVVRPVQRAAATVYGEGSSLLDERFNVLPGLEE